MKGILKRTGIYIFHITMVVLLTLITQVGGLVYLTVWCIGYFLKIPTWRKWLYFVVIYILATVLIIPPVAGLFGRVALPWFGKLKPLNKMTCLLNRHYVVPEIRDLLIEESTRMPDRFGDSSIQYLDANFPFFNGYPLWPHLSHSDGKKIDISFFYKNSVSDIPTHSSPSFIGYGGYERPFPGEINYPEICRQRNAWQYSFLSKIIPENHEGLNVDAEKTAYLIKRLALAKKVSNIFIEPHLKQRWKLAGLEKVRFHGCQAVRHDDHIHFQIR